MSYYRITLENSAGKLDQRIAAKQNDIGLYIRHMTYLYETVFKDGDIIRIAFVSDKEAS